MEKYNSAKHSVLGRKLPFSYFSTDLYLDFAGYFFERNGEQLVVWQDIIYPNEFPCIFMPQKEENWDHCCVAFATEQNLAALKQRGIEILVKNPMGSEYFYDTASFVEPTGSFKSRVKQFQGNYKYSVLHKCDHERLADFHAAWKSQREHQSISFAESEIFFDFCFRQLDKYGIKQVYVEVNGKIVGLAWGLEFPGSDNWIGLHLKVDYQYKGLSRFLHHERAKMFAGRREFSLGTGAHDKGITQYKEELHPIRQTDYHYILTGEKKSSAVPTR